MKTIHLSFFLIMFIFNNANAQRTIKEYIAVPSDTEEEQILYLKDSTKGIPSYISPGQNEVNYISNGVSNFGFTNSENKIFVWWNSCDDMTKSKYIIYKTTDNINYEVVSETTNMPSNIHSPILHCTSFINSTPYHNQFFLFYKKYENGSMAHIITLVIPKQLSKKLFSKL